MTDVVVSAVQPAGELARSDRLRQFTKDWLANRRFSDNTRDAYRRDVLAWLDWCEDNDLDPLTVRFTDVNAWGRELERPTDGGRPLAASTVARRMSAVSSWYTFLAKLGAVDTNPAAIADRPEVDRHYSDTVSFTKTQAMDMLAVAGERSDPIGPVGPLLAAWLVQLGTRATETTSVDLANVSYDRGHRVVKLAVKGNRWHRRTIPPALADLLDQYLEIRAAGGDPGALTGPLFVDAQGRQLDRHAVYRFVQRLARSAGLPNWERISPHSFRHAWNAMARAGGALLEDRQDAMGHRDPRTTRRYDRTAAGVEHDPAMLVAAAVTRREEEAGSGDL